MDRFCQEKRDRKVQKVLQSSSAIRAVVRSFLFAEILSGY